MTPHTTAPPHVVRRRLLTVGLLAFALLVTGCGSSSGGAESETGSDDKASGPWTFTDDLGKEVSLDKAPTRVAGLTDIVSSLWNYGIEPVAAFGFTGISDDERFDDFDTSKVVEVGKAYGEINLESLAAARPDIIVTNAYPVDSAGKVDPKTPLYGFKDLAQQQAVEKIAPIVTITMKGSAKTVIERTADLAVALGVSRDSGPLAESQEDFEKAEQRLSAAGKSGLSVLVVAAYPDEGLYVAKAPDDPALRSYADLGVDFVDPGGKDYYWEVVSWENVGKVPADIVLYSRRAMDDKAMDKQPTFARTEAAKADQVYPWVFAGMDYPAMADYMNELSGYLEKSTKLT